MINEMKVLAKSKPEPGLWMETRPVPEIGPDDVLIRINKTGICGTDIHIWNWDEWAQKTVPSPWSPATNSRERSWRSAATSRGCPSASAVRARGI
jgi:NADPH:quinone reductase-like Zn-dependent oxidoreductase